MGTASERPTSSARGTDSEVCVPLGVTAFGANVIVYPPGYEGFHHYHTRRTSSTSVYSGSARVEVEDEDRILGYGHFSRESTTPRKVSNASETEDLVLLVVGGKGGYVEHDGHMVDPADVEETGVVRAERYAGLTARKNRSCARTGGRGTACSDRRGA